MWELIIESLSEEHQHHHGRSGNIITSKKCSAGKLNYEQDILRSSRQLLFSHFSFYLKQGSILLFMVETLNSILGQWTVKLLFNSNTSTVFRMASNCTSCISVITFFMVKRESEKDLVCENGIITKFAFPTLWNISKLVSIAVSDLEQS